uniref:DSBA domain-containing protein n=1 Tax=Syphacia muris TaxID=451379 RepID=A0A0N5AKH8_9BILA
MANKLYVKAFLDVSCPYSWIGFKMLKQRTKLWEKKNVNIDTFPVTSRSIRSVSVVIQDNAFLTCEYFRYQFYTMDDTIEAKDFSTRQGNSLTRGSFLLNLIKTERPNLYEMAFDMAWKTVWSDNAPFNRSPHFFKLCRAIGLSFRDSDDIVSRLETVTNIKLFRKNSNLACSYGAVDTPCFVVLDERSKFFTLCSIFRFPQADFLIENPSLLEKIGSSLEHVENTEA